ncbi:MAG: hypothetical protein U0411_06280 [Thermodesulfovibrionales bacterium]
MKRERMKVGVHIFLLFLCAVLLLLSTMEALAEAATEVIVDNGGTGTSHTGSWAVSGGANPYGKNSLYGQGGAKYTWKASLLQAGKYEVYAWWTVTSTRSRSAPLKITYSGGSATVRVNQQTNGGSGTTWGRTASVPPPGGQCC